MKEIWMPIPGYEGLYEISTEGRVKSLCSGRWHTEMIRKGVRDKNGYLTVNLKKDGRYICAKVHRLVATTFIDNPNGYPHVNHKDCDKTNNSVTNLEWCTAAYNNAYKDKYKCTNKAVKQIHDGVIINTYESIRLASKATGTNETCISMVLHGKRKKAGGYEWAYQY